MKNKEYSLTLHNNSELDLTAWLLEEQHILKVSYGGV